MRGLFTATALVLGLLVFAAPARALIAVGATAPDFSKQELVGGVLGPFHSLYQHAEQPVVVLWLLGHG